MSLAASHRVWHWNQGHASQQQAVAVPKHRHAAGLAWLAGAAGLVGHCHDHTQGPSALDYVDHTHKLEKIGCKDCRVITSSYLCNSDSAHGSNLSAKSPHLVCLTSHLSELPLCFGGAKQCLYSKFLLQKAIIASEISIPPPNAVHITLSLFLPVSIMARS